MVRFGSTDRQVTEGELITPDDARAATAMQAASEILPALTNISAESVRIGIRPIPLDGFPVAGWDPTRPGLYHVVTHSGVTLGPVLGRLVAADVAGASAIELATFRPDRAA
jgi:glycine/D-amino acid oxidase-like deaminating enzyme